MIANVTNKYLDMYRNMYLSRYAEERLIELYKQGIVRGTVLTGDGNEAAIVAAVSAMDPETDVCNLMQRDFAGYISWGVDLYHLFSHYIANMDSITQGKDGNVHHGLPERGLLPMISHLGAMIPNVVGAVYAKRKQGIDSIGLAIIGDGATSTGDVHEAMNIASVLKVPVLFFIENNQWAYATPNRLQFNCDDLSKRAAGYGIKGKRIKAVDAVKTHSVISEIIDEMRASSEPYILQTDTYRFRGHAAYDTGDYMPAAELAEWKREDPVPLMRTYLISEKHIEENELVELEKTWSEEISEAANAALAAEKLDPSKVSLSPYSDNVERNLPPFQADDCTPVQATRSALDHALEYDKDIILLGEDIGELGGPFKTTKGLFEKYGRERIIDMPLAESGFSGFAIGAAEMGLRPVIEMQFSDFSTDAVTQLGVNGGTYYFRTGRSLPLTVRMPTGGGLSFGPFHSQDLEGLFGTFPGLKIVYPSFVEDYFSLLLATIYDDNPVLFFESKYLHRRIKGNIRFDGKVESLNGGRIVRQGSDVSILSYGAMMHEVIAAADNAEKEMGISVEIIDPRILKPFDRELLIESVSKTHRLLIVHESWQACSIGSWIISNILEDVFFELEAPPVIYTAPDTPVPFAPELEGLYRPDQEGIVKRLEKLMNF